MKRNKQLQVLAIVHEIQEKRFVIRTCPNKIIRTIAYLSYDVKMGGEREMDLQHTYVHRSMRGKNLGKLLCDQAYAWAKKKNVVPIASCSYIRDHYIPKYLNG